MNEKKKFFDWYKSINYNNKDKILIEAKIALKKYEGSKNINHPICNKRIENYKYVIEMLEPIGQQKLF